MCNNNIKVKVKKIYKDAKIPENATAGSAGFDLKAYVDEVDGYGDKKVWISPGGRVKIETGIAFELPENHVMLIFPRSSVGIKKGLRLQNSTGVLDSDYRNQAFIFLENMSEDNQTVEHGERIAQAIIIPYPTVEFEEVEELSTTERGLGGIGSTGKF